MIRTLAVLVLLHEVKEPNEFDLMLVMEDLPVRYIGYRIRGTSFLHKRPDQLYR